jgi:thiol:disulfide interchange protein DsbG
MVIHMKRTFIVCMKPVLVLLLFCFVNFAHGQSTKPISEQTWQQIKTLQGVRSQPGMTNPSVFIFFDPNCPYCAKLWQTQVENSQFNKIPAVWIPVSYLGETALGKSAALLRENTTASLAANFAGFNYEIRQGAIAAVTPTDKEMKQLGQAKSVWLKLGGATPLIAFRSRTGDAQLFLGLPSDTRLKEIASLFTQSTLSTFPAK